MDITGLTGEPLIVSADELPFYDVSAGGNRKVTFAQFKTALALATIATSGSASDLASGTVPTARLGSGTANSSSFLRGDQTWAAVTVPAAASDAEQEAGSSTSVYTSPGRQHRHPSAAKGWIKHGTNGVASASYNMDNSTDNGTGDWTHNLTTDMSSANYAGVATAGMAGANATACSCKSQAAGTFRVVCINYLGTFVDPDSPAAVYGVYFGDQ